MQAIIFDMYGVIMKAPEGDLIPFIRSDFPEITNDIINSLWKEAAYGLKTSHEFFQNIGYREKISDVEKEYLESIEIDETFLDIAHRLKSNYKLILLSNDISEWSKYLRRKFGLCDLFDKIVISGDYRILKPDNRLFNVILNYLNIPASECCYIDDRIKNINLASQLGLKAILFNRSNLTYDGIMINDFQGLISYLTNMD